VFVTRWGNLIVSIYLTLADATGPEFNQPLKDISTKEGMKNVFGSTARPVREAELSHL
jgi:hypothetical protein